MHLFCFEKCFKKQNKKIKNKKTNRKTTDCITINVITLNISRNVIFKIMNRINRERNNKITLTFYIHDNLYSSRQLKQTSENIQPNIV